MEVVSASSDTPDDLLDRCLQGDEQSWYLLVGHHAGLVYAIARKAGLGEHDCDEVAQIVFAALARSLDKIRDRRALTAWLMTSARREAWRVSAARRRSGALDPGVVESQAAFAEDVARLEDHARVRDAMDKLGDRCRELLRALYFAPNLSYEQVSNMLDIPVGSIGPTRQRCLARLAEIMRNDRE